MITTRSVALFLVLSSLIIVFPAPVLADNLATVAPQASDSNFIDPDNPPLMKTKMFEGQRGSPVPPPVASASRRLPVEVNITDWSDPVANQGRVGSCTTWSTAYGMAGWWANRSGRKTKFRTIFGSLSMSTFARGNANNFWLNPMSVYAPIVRGQNIGTYASDVGGYLIAKGVVPSNVYTAGQMDYNYLPNRIEQRAALRFRLKGYKPLFRSYPIGGGSGGAYRIKKILASKKPVTISMLTDKRLGRYDGYDSVYKQEPCYTRRSTCGAHSMMAVGYNNDGLIVQNSWGHWWGRNGFVTIDWTTVANDIFEAWTATGLQ